MGYAFKMTRVRLFSAVASSAIVLCSGPTYAQAAPSGVDEKPIASSQSGVNSPGDIVVTAQRRSESLLRVPLAVSAIGGDALQRRGITQPAELRSIIPNLQVNDSTGGAEPNFTLRGIGIGTDYSSNQASPVGVYSDDAYLAFRSEYNGQMFDLERVEVLRGPQGTLFGRNTTGGAINFITKKPDLEGEKGYFDLGYGNYNDVRAEGAVEQTLIAGVLGVRAAVSYERHDGYFHNVYPGGADPTAGNNLRSRVAIRFRPSELLDVNLKLFANHGHFNQPDVLSTGTLPNGVNPNTGYSRAGLGFYDVDSDKLQRDHTSSQGGSLTVKLHISDDFTVQSLSSYDTAKSLFAQDVDGSPVDVLQGVYNDRYKEFNQELRAVYDKGIVKAQAGLFYGRDRIAVDNRYTFLKFLDALGVPPDPNLERGGGTIIQQFTQVRESKAVFGQADVQLLPKLTLTVGARYTKDTAIYKNGLATFGDYDFNPIQYNIGTPDAPLYRRGSSRAVTGRAALNYKFDSGVLVYASYSRGYRGGTFNGGAYQSPTQVAFVAPETVDAYEVGSKGRFFNGALTASAAAFIYDYAHQQISDQVGNFSFLRSGGSATLRGVELESTARFSSAASLTANVGYIDSKYGKLSLDGSDLTGNQLPLTPHLTVNGRFDYTVAEVLGGSLLLSPSVTYTSHEFFTPYNNAAGNAPLQQGGFTVVDAQVEWKKGPWSARLWGKNLTGTHYYVYDLNLRPLGFIYHNPGNPRTFGVALHWAF